VDEEPLHPIQDCANCLTMRYYMILSLGFFAQLLFASRMVVQWVQSERAGRIISPTVFWQTSLLASFLLMVYGILRHDAVIIGGQLVSYFIYIRNLQLKNEWKTFHVILRLVIVMLPVFALSTFFYSDKMLITQVFLKNNIRDFYFMIGVIGQLFLNFRFVYQWYLSEKHHHSYFPLGFWILSVIGSVLVVTYGFFRHDPVLIFAQTLGFIIYSRNIMIGKHHTLE
jgi:lipid-A-disaccharide synthase-like uncharacterized protein